VVHAGRRKGKTRSRVLYWFRTPPGVRVGRAALDEDAIRLIERHNPDVEFDWTRILKSQGEETKPAPSRERFDRGRRRPDPRPAAVVPAEPAVGPETPVALARQPEPQAPALESRDFDAADLEPIGIGVADAESIAALDLDENQSAKPPPQDPLPPTPAHARLGSEGVLRLRARYSEVLARISERTPDPVRQEQLKTQAERLNPDTWVTGAEVSAGLEEYETVFEALRSVIGGQLRRRGRKRRRGGGPQSSQTPQAATGNAGTNERDDEDQRAEDL
jgi:hypothetical protein